MNDLMRRTILPITNSEVLTCKIKGEFDKHPEAPVQGFIEGQTDSGFLAEITFKNETYKGFLIKIDPSSKTPQAGA
jgi:hypothetical protein